MNCEKTRPLLVPFLEEELSGAAREEVTRHLEGCAGCREEMRLLSATWEALGRYEAPALREGFTASVMEKVRLEAARPAPALRSVPLFGVRTLALASVALILTGVAIYSWVRPGERPLQEPVPAIRLQAPSIAAEKAGEEEAVVTYVTGPAKVLLNGQKDYVDAEVGMALASGDALATGPAGAMEISFDSGNNKVVRVQADSKASIVLQGNEKMSVTDGEVFATIHALPAHSSFEIRTPTAVTGARGTAWTTRVTAEGTTIEAFERTPYIKAVEQGGRVSSRETEVSAGYSTVIGPVRKPQPLQPIRAERMAHYAALKNDVRRHAEEEMISRQKRPTFDRSEFIKKNRSGGRQPQPGVVGAGKDSRDGLAHGRQEGLRGGPRNGQGPDTKQTPVKDQNPDTRPGPGYRQDGTGVNRGSVLDSAHRRGPGDEPQRGPGGVGPGGESQKNSGGVGPGGQRSMGGPAIGPGRSPGPSDSAIGPGRSPGRGDAVDQRGPGSGPGVRRDTIGQERRLGPRPGRPGGRPDGGPGNGGGRPGGGKPGPGGKPGGGGSSGGGRAGAGPKK